jgi:hypothetical protein
MGMASGGHPYPSATAVYDNEPVPAQPDFPLPRRKRSGRMKSVDELFGPLVKAGLVKIVRKKGHAPKIIWL